MSIRIFTKIWGVKVGLRRANIVCDVELTRARSSTTVSSFERIPREELVTKFKSRLRNRKYLPGSTGVGFPEFLAEPRDTFPLYVRVMNRYNSSLVELTILSRKYVKENFASIPAILFRDLPLNRFSLRRTSFKLPGWYSASFADWPQSWHLHSKQRT